MKARHIAACAAGLALLTAANFSHGAVIEVEYFLGSDPGEGNGTKLELPTASDSTATDLPQVALANNLLPGTHRIGLRVKDAAGRWSNPLFRRVTIYPAAFSVPPSGPALTANRLMAAEYFLGNDPGEGRATSLQLTEEGLTAATGAASPLSADAAPGTFTVGLRFKDTAGRWGNPLLRRTTVRPASAVAATISNLPAGNAIPPEPASPQSHRLSLAGAFHCGGLFGVTIGDKSIEIPARPFETAVSFMERLALAINADPALGSMVEAAAAGASSVIVTAKNPGRHHADWVVTSPNLRTTLIKEGTLGDEGRKIVAAEYFVGLEPLPGSGLPIVLGESGSNAAFFAEQSFQVSNLRDGSHPVGVRFKNAAGHWGKPIRKGLTSYALLGEKDRSRPAIILQGANPLSIPYGLIFTEPGYSAIDDIDGDLSARVVTRGEVNTSIPGEYTLEYWVDDLAGNRTSKKRTVLVTDSQQPVFAGGDDIVHTVPPATIDLFAGLRAIDPQFGDLSYRIRLLSSNVDWFSAGTYLASFEVEDPAGNKAYLSRNITLTQDATFYPGYQTWINGHGVLAQATGGDLQPSADPDQDGQTNEQEWQADTDPFNKWSALSMEYIPSQTQEIMRWSALQRIAYRMEASANLETWSAYGDEVTLQESCVLEYEFPRDSTKQRLFYRLKAYPKKPLLELP